MLKRKTAGKILMGFVCWAASSQELMAVDSDTANKIRIKQVRLLLKHAEHVFKYARDVSDDVKNGRQPRPPDSLITGGDSVLKRLDDLLAELQQIKASEMPVPQSVLGTATGPVVAKLINAQGPNLSLFLGSIQEDNQTLIELEQAVQVADDVSTAGRELEKIFAELMGVPNATLQRLFGFAAIEMSTIFNPKISQVRSTLREKVRLFNTAERQASLKGLLQVYSRTLTEEKDKLDRAAADLELLTEWLRVREADLREELEYLHQLYDNLQRQRAHQDQLSGTASRQSEQRAKAMRQAEALQRDLNVEYRDCPNGHPYAVCRHPDLKQAFDNKMAARRASLQSARRTIQRIDREVAQTKSQLDAIASALEKNSAQYNKRRTKYIDVDAETQKKREQHQQLLSEGLKNVMALGELNEAIGLVKSLDLVIRDMEKPHDDRE